MFFQNILWNSKIYEIFETVLHIACESRNFDLVQYLISLNKIDLNTRNKVFNHYN